VPRTCDIPTGLGKTAVIPIWLIALVYSGEDLKCRLIPRRLVYIVNRRTVVDQATGVVEQIRDRLLKPGHPDWAKHEKTLRSLSDGLRRLAATGDLPLAISTLRGELADNQEWKADPPRPAIVIGTVDMIGGKLLFSGYGDGFRMRPHHAGLIGQDALFAHDEAHLTPAFGELLNQEVSAPRFSYLPLPTIGHPHADGMIRRVLITGPHGGDGRHASWARSRLVNASLVDTGQRVQAILTLPERPKEVYPLYHGESQAWCSVTPVALPGYDDGRQTKTE
jgi:hypothetical protein